MMKRTAVTIAVWLVGLLFLVTDGQHFTHGVVVFCSAVLGALPWVSVVRKPHGAGRRFTALAIIGVSAATAVRVTFHLPGAYEAQRRFNAAVPTSRLTP